MGRRRAMGSRGPSRSRRAILACGCALFCGSIPTVTSFVTSPIGPLMPGHQCYGTRSRAVATAAAEGGPERAKGRGRSTASPSGGAVKEVGSAATGGKEQGGGTKAGGGQPRASKPASSASRSGKGGAGAPKKAEVAPRPRQHDLGDELAWALSAQTELPDLDTLAPPLSDRQLLTWERDGHTITRGLVSAKDMQNYAKIVRAAFERERRAAYEQKIKVMFGPAELKACEGLEDMEELLDEVDPEYIIFLQTFNSWRKYKDVRKLVLAKRFAHVAAQLMGVPRVRLYHDSTFFKRPGDGPTRWHSDLNQSPFDSNDMITMWLPVTEVPAEEEGGSPLAFASRSHRDFALNYWSDPHAAEDLGERYPDVHSYGRINVGDATWHHGWTLHSSGPNELDEPRVALTVCYIADGAKLIGAKAKNKPDDEDYMSYDTWIKDFKPGAKIGDHPLLPLVWDEEKNDQTRQKR